MRIIPLVDLEMLQPSEALEAVKNYVGNDIAFFIEDFPNPDQLRVVEIYKKRKPSAKVTLMYRKRRAGKSALVATYKMIAMNLKIDEVVDADEVPHLVLNERPEKEITAEKVVIDIAGGMPEAIRDEEDAIEFVGTVLLYILNQVGRPSTVYLYPVPYPIPVKNPKAFWLFVKEITSLQL